MLAVSSLLAVNGTYFSEPDNITEKTFWEPYLKLDADEIAILAHQSKDMIKSCTTQGQLGDEKCKELMAGTTRVFTPDYGLCYIFSNVHKDAMNNSMTVDNAGPNYGLTLQVDVEGTIVITLNSSFEK